MWRKIELPNSSAISTVMTMPNNTRIARVFLISQEMKTASYRPKNNRAIAISVIRPIAATNIKMTQYSNLCTTLSRGFVS